MFRPCPAPPHSICSTEGGKAKNSGMSSQLPPNGYGIFTRKTAFPTSTAIWCWQNPRQVWPRSERRPLPSSRLLALVRRKSDFTYDLLRILDPAYPHFALSAHSPHTRGVWEDEAVLPADNSAAKAGMALGRSCPSLSPIQSSETWLIDRDLQSASQRKVKPQIYPPNNVDFTDKKLRGIILSIADSLSSCCEIQSCHYSLFRVMLVCFILFNLTYTKV